MLSREENDLLTQTDPETPMGGLFRLYWIPALLSSELPEPDCAPVRVKLMEEELVEFRDSDGEIGLVDERCPHRGVSLFFGKNENCGLSCAYHGWKFNTKGECMDMPTEPPSSVFKTKVKLKSYPCIERAGVIWTYMGPKELQPPLPDIIWNTIPEENTYITKRVQKTNYLQALEGGLDSSHISILHKGAFDYNVSGASDIKKYIANSASPKYEVVETDFGALMGAGRDTGEGTIYWRSSAFLMPFFQLVCPYSEEPRNGHVWVPIDDEHCMNWCINWHPSRELTDEEITNFQRGLGIHTDLMEGTFQPIQNKSNNYLMDRGQQLSGQSNSGIRGVGTQDAAVQESQGEIYDRTNERLGMSDAAIIALRKMLLKSVTELKKGNLPRSKEADYGLYDAPAVVISKDQKYKKAIWEYVKFGNSYQTSDTAVKESLDV